jgi:formylglycine-generating enzyme required for sulfatase activity
MSRPLSFHRWLVVVLLSALLAGMAWVAAGLAQTTTGKKHALLVGVRSYDHKKLEDLKYTENDVEELALALKGFNEVVVLTSTRGAKRADAVPTAANIRKQLERLLQRATKHDTIVVGLAGHGLQIKVKVKDAAGQEKEIEEGFFCPSDAKPREDVTLAQQSETMLGFTELFRKLDDSGVGVKLLLVDACRNDPSAGRSVNADVMPHAPRGMAALFSCRTGERAFETPKLGKGHGVFFHHVIQGLRGEARNKRGEVTWDALAIYVKEQVSDGVPVLIGGGAKQTPEEIKKLEGKPPVLVALGKTDLEKNPPPARAKVVKGWADEVTNSIGMKLVRIPAGKFTMGSPPEESNHRPEEEQHEVEITRPFWLGIHEVTQKEFKVVMGFNPSFFSANGTGKKGVKYPDASKPAGGKDRVKGELTDDFPVENVSWIEADEFCKKLSALLGEMRAKRSYRLPTEAEWEYACRGGEPSTTAYHFGRSLSGTQANFTVLKTKQERARKVGSYPKNGFGLCDMHGNVQEWCFDWYGEDYYGKSPPRNPHGPSRGTARVIRGGGWTSFGAFCRSAYRRLGKPDLRINYLGFRVALVPSAK